MLPRIFCVVLLLLANLGVAPAQTGPLRGATRQSGKKPNVIVVITDDQGHGDLGFHGNPVIKTPNLDKLARQSVRMKNFHVSPVCSPTRASLMTGRYNYRTGVVDTFVGRSMMHSDETTIAALLRALGYRTGIFGKWHLGDNYPLRSIDHGFMESLVLTGGGIGQPSDPPGGESYFNPILQHNGKAVRKEDYCTDIFTDAAIDFVGKNKDSPFFCYVAFNCPHGPLEVPKKYHDMYKDKINIGQFPKFGFPVGKVNLDETAKIYGMITNIDDNIGRLLAKLDELGIADDTIVIFLTDNGPQQPRYNSGMRGRKASLFEGGTHVPFFVRWPAQLPKDRDVIPIGAHIRVGYCFTHRRRAELPARPANNSSRRQAGQYSLVHVDAPKVSRPGIDEKPRFTEPTHAIEPGLGDDAVRFPGAVRRRPNRRPPQRCLFAGGDDVRHAHRRESVRQRHDDAGRHAQDEERIRWTGRESRRAVAERRQGDRRCDSGRSAKQAAIRRRVCRRDDRRGTLSGPPPRNGRQTASASKKSKEGQEKRMATRYDVELTTHFRPINGSRVWPAWIRDISPMGARLHAQRRFEPGTVIEVILANRAGDVQLTQLAHIRRIEPTRNNSWHLGCEFTNPIDPDILDAILSDEMDKTDMG